MNENEAMSEPRKPPIGLDEFRAMLDKVRAWRRTDRPKGISIILPAGRPGRRQFAELLKNMDRLPPSSACARLPAKTTRKRQ